MPIERLRPSFSFDEVQINELKRIAPEAFADGKINWETLKEALGEHLEEENSEVEHFGLFWPGKREARKIASIPSHGTLVPAYGEGLNADGTPDKDSVNDSHHIFIEGENLEVLKIFQKSYAGRIKMIYIDPPYNTGNDFVYDDNFTEPIQEYLKRTGQLDEEGKLLTSNKKADGRFHSKWLSMMYPRLKLAKNLLTEDGLIYVSIDDNEVHNLRFLMNEIFGEENCLACIANINNPKGRSDDKYFARSHEYLLVYQKSESVILGWDPEEKVTVRYNKLDETGKKYREIDLRKTGDNDKREDRPNLFYYFLYNEDTKEFFPTMEELVPSGFIQIKPTRSDGSDGNWRWELKTALKNLESLIPKFMTVRQKWTVFEKDLLTDDLKIKPTTSWTHKDINSERGTEQFISLGFDKKDFPKPKPIGLINRILELSVKGDEPEIVLDFFNGSGTFQDAVYRFNENNNGCIKYIGVQLPEIIENKDIKQLSQFRNIAEITKERCRRVVKKIDCPDKGFEVYKLTNSHFKKGDEYNGSTIEKLEIHFDEKLIPIIDSWSEPGLLSEIKLIEGYPLDCKNQLLDNFKYNRVQKVSNPYENQNMFVCLDSKISDETIDQLHLGDNDIFICMDTSISDQDKLRLTDKGLIKTI